MKSLIVSFLLVFSALSYAMGEHDIFVADSEDGGKILLLSQKCPLRGSEGARISIATTKDYYIIGCWFPYEESIFAIWLPENVEPIRSEYDPEDFLLEKLL
jgi:hypothetical protein